MESQKSCKNKKQETNIMERIIKRLLLIVGIVVGGGVALAPLTSYAAVNADTLPKNVSGWTDATYQTNCNGGTPINSNATAEQCTAYTNWKIIQSHRYVSSLNNEESNGQIEYQLTIDDTLILEVENTKTIQASPNMLNSGMLTAKVTSNFGYELQLSAATPALTHTGSLTNTIPAVDSSTGIAADDFKTQVGWGVKKVGMNNDNYFGLTADPVTFYIKDGPRLSNGAVTDDDLTQAADVVNFPIGVGVGTTTPSGTYSTEVTVTAVVKE